MSGSGPGGRRFKSFRPDHSLYNQRFTSHENPKRAWYLTHALLLNPLGRKRLSPRIHFSASLFPGEMSCSEPEISAGDSGLQTFVSHGQPKLQLDPTTSSDQAASGNQRF